MTKNLPKRKGLSWALLTACLFLLSFTAAFAADVTSTATGGDWNSATTWNFRRMSGTISISSNARTVVTGNNTQFTTELSVGSVLRRTTNGTVIGTVAAINSNTSLTLVSAFTGNTFSTSSFDAQQVPAANDVVIITPGATINVTGNASINSVIFNNTGTGTGTLNVASGATLSVATSITVRNASDANISAMLTGSGTINCASVQIGGTTTSLSEGQFLTTLTSEISNLNVSGNLSLDGEVYTFYFIFPIYTGTNSSELRINSGLVTVGGSVNQNAESETPVFTTVRSSVSIVLNEGQQSGTLQIGGSEPFTVNGGGTYNFHAAGTNATVIYSGANQTIRPTTYTNLTLSGSGPKTLANNNSITVKGNWTNNGVIFNAGNNTVTFGGTTLQTIGGTSPTTFNNITINNAAGVAFEQSGATSGLTLTSGKLFIRPGATLTKNTNSAVAGGPFSTAKYIVTEVNTTTGQKGVFRMNALNANTNYTFPVGTPAYYLPAIVRPVSTGAVAATVFTPLTQNGEPDGVPYSDLSRFVNAVWQINKVAGTNNGATITLNWDNALEGGYFAIQPGSDIGIRQFTGGTNVSGSEGDNGNNTTNTVSRPFDFFGSFVVSASGSEISLPVNFANVKATKKAGGVDVAFSNLTEEDVAVYHVERSTNGVQYQSIATIAPKANNNSRADYQYTDKTPVSGNNYYRIRAVETTGKQVFSAVVKVGVEGSAASMVLYPNPASKSSGINLQLANLPAGVYSIRLFNSNGQVIGTKQLQHNGGSISESLPLNGASAGRYVVDVKGAVQFTQSFLLQ